MSEPYNEKKAIRLLDLLKQGTYNDFRSDSIIIKELLNVLIYLSKMIEKETK